MLIGFAAVILTGCDSKTETLMGVECEKIATGERGDYVLKCPSAPKMEKFRSMEANAMFLSAGDPASYVADKEHIYINVIKNGCGDNTIGYRILAKDAVFDDGVPYAVNVCKKR